MNVYRGGRRQRGYGIGGVFSSFFRKTSPFLKKSGLKVAKNTLSTLSDVVGDVEKGRDVVESLKRRGKTGAWKTLQDIGPEVIKSIPEVVGDIFNSGSKQSSRKRKRSDSDDDDDHDDIFS